MKHRYRLLLASALAFSVMAISSKETATGMDGVIEYEASVLPVLQKKCMSCHGTTTERPFFYDLPIVSRWTRPYVDRKIQTALTSFEILPSFSGAEEETIDEYAAKLRRALQEKRMPPTPYLLLHPDHRLTEEEGQLIVEWATSEEG